MPEPETTSIGTSEPTATTDECADCVAQFMEAGGCECWMDEECDESQHIPNGCFSCADSAAEACGISADETECDATQTCYATCTYAPATCDDLMQMLSSGGCAETCCSNIFDSMEQRLCGNSLVLSYSNVF